jgi:ComB9 competence protein
LLPASAAKQAREQRQGQFPAMSRPPGGGQIQDVWNESGLTDGVQQYRMCGDCIYKVRTRQFMTTAVVLPEDAVIKEVDLGDPVGFQAKVNRANVIALRPASYGMDTNLTVHTASGDIYAFYVRSESFNSKNVPDLLVRVSGRETPEPVAPPALVKDQERRKEKVDFAALRERATTELNHLKTPSGDFVEEVVFDPGKLHGWADYKLWGAEELRPEVVFRDERFTYLQYGKKWAGLDLPTAYVVVDDIDEVVNTRVQGRTYIIESTSPLITLKSGKKFLCIEYAGKAAS